MGWPPIKQSTAVESIAGERLTFSVENSIYKAVKAAAKRLKMTPTMVLLHSFYLLLKEIDPQSQKITVGIPAANRDLDGAESMIGNCANLLPIQFSGDWQSPILDQMKSVKSNLIQAYQNMTYPYEQLQVHAGGPLFNVSFNVEPMAELPDFNDVTLFMYAYPIVACEFDMIFNVTDLEYFYHWKSTFALQNFERPSD